MNQHSKAQAAEYWRRWYAENGEALNAGKRAKRKADPSYLIKQRADYYARLEEKRAYHREWQTAHPRSQQQKFANTANQSARKYGSSERLDLHNLPTGPCVYCGRDDQTVSWDHVIPLSRGGPNQASNCARSCLSCNHHKYNKTPEEWADAAAIQQRRERKRIYIRDWHRTHYAELYAKRKAKRQETGHW